MTAAATSTRFRTASLLPTTVDGGNRIGTDDYVPFFKARITVIRCADLAR